ncbi:hypothetical protein K435DRAFT_764012 [Dendrothele bispora CBS 962.96]|uniref:Protein HRI1 n=1 Tax=Dendrothele bispora (strain CBS 962.96) TaxID=1314807 RepID=A0A4S8LA20_DENBC|nr:hypothetical protein K435DRAFT_764012 [Dendrothele bispora CBS 962.96]
MPFSISLRQSIRWIPGSKNEPTDTIVLTGLQTGFFIDVRFLKGTNELDWAFAGYRENIDGGVKTKFTHLIDARTENASEIDDCGTNVLQADGTTLETGEMVNPETGIKTPYEEVWQDIECADSQGLLLRNSAGTEWYGQVGDWQLAVGRSNGNFWAWQACREKSEWKVKNCTRTANFKLLPKESEDWKAGTVIAWEDQEWNILEVTE